MLTGQDVKALAAVAACWALYAGSDHNGQAAALISIRALLRGMQSKCHMFARELIAQSMDWSDRLRVWPMVMDPPPSGPPKSLAESLLGVGEALREMADEERATPPSERGLGLMVGGAIIAGKTIKHGRRVGPAPSHGPHSPTFSTPPPLSDFLPATEGRAAMWLCNSCLAVVPAAAERDASGKPMPCPECSDYVLCSCADCLELVPVVQGLPTMDERARACHSAGYGFKLKQAGG